MTYVAARMNIIEGLIKVEATYGTDSAPAPATDAVWLAKAGDTPDLMPDTWGFNGDNGPNSVGVQPRLGSAPGQRSATVGLDMYFQGAGAAYSAGVVPLNGLHPIMKCCGYTATFSGGVGSEIWTYAPTGDGTTPTSGTIWTYSRQMLGGSNFRLSKMTGALGSLKVAAPDLKPPVFSGTFKGIYTGDPTEAALTAPTLSSATLAPNGAGMVFTVDGTALKLYNWSFDAARDYSSDRVPMTSATGYLGVVSGGWMPKLKFQIEDELFATFNSYTKRASAATASIVLTFGTVQYNKMTLTIPTGQVSNVTEAGKGKVGLMDIEVTCVPSTPAGDNSHSWVAA